MMTLIQVIVWWSTAVSCQSNHTGLAHIPTHRYSTCPGVLMPLGSSLLMLLWDFSLLLSASLSLNCYTSCFYLHHLLGKYLNIVYSATVLKESMHVADSLWNGEPLNDENFRGLEFVGVEIWSFPLTLHMVWALTYCCTIAVVKFHWSHQ